VPREEIQAALVQEGANEITAITLASLSGGRPGWSLQALRDPTRQRINDRDEALMFLTELLPADKVKRLSFAEEMVSRWQNGGQKRASVLTIINIWLGWWRDLALVQQDLTDYVTNFDRLDELKKLSGKFSLNQIKEMLRGLTRTQAELEANVAPRLAIGDLLLNVLPPHK
jgi:hypothetical protein